MQTTPIVTAETIALVHEALMGSTTLSNGMSADDLFKSWVQPGSFPGGFQSWDLETPAKSLFPVLTPLRNRIPRKSANGGIQANWKAITGINTTNLDIGIPDGARGQLHITTTADYNASYKQFGLDDTVTWGAQWSAEQLIDLRSRAQTNLLWAVMLGEEALDLGGNTSLALGQGNQPSVADVGTGGSLSPNTTYSVIVAPLTLAGLNAATVAGGVRGLVAGTSADGSTAITYGGGTGQPSTNRTVTTANDGNSTHSLSASTATVAGAMGYAWFLGAAGSEKLAAITTINSVVLTSVAAGTQLASSLAADNSTNSLVYDGILTQIWKAGGYQYTMPTGTAGTGSGLTADGAGGIVEIDAALQYFWDKLRLSPSTIWVNSQEQRNITKKVLAGTTTAAQRFMIAAEQGNIKGGDLVVAYLNKFGMNGSQALAVRVHPNLPAGTLMFDTETLPYPLNDTPEVLVKRCRQDYFSTMWAPRSRKYEYGTYFDGVLQNYFPAAFGTINNIGNA